MKFVLIAAAGLACATQADTVTNAARALTLQEAVNLALEHNLDVQVQRYTLAIDKFSLEAAFGAYDLGLNLSGSETYRNSPGNFNPSLGLSPVSSQSYDQNFSTGLGGANGGNALTPWGMTYGLRANSDKVNVVGKASDQYNTSMSLTLDQPLLKNAWIDSPRETIELTKKTMTADELALRDQIINVVEATEEAYYNLVAAYESINVQETAVQLASQLVAENKKKVEVGALAPLDEKQAESQLSTGQANLIAARQTADTAQNTLKDLITDHYSEWARVSVKPTDLLMSVPELFDLQDSWNKGLSLRPDLLQLKVNLEKNNITLKFQYNQLFPQLDLTGTYGRSGVFSSFGETVNQIGTERFPNYSFGATMSLPLSNRTAKNNYKSTKALIEQTLLQYKRLEQTIMKEVQNSVVQAQSSLEQIKARESAVDYAQAALDAEQKKLEQGKSTSFQVLQLQQNLTQAKSDRISALVSYNIALAQLNKNQGTTLEHRKLDVKKP